MENFQFSPSKEVWTVTYMLLLADREHMLLVHIITHVHCIYSLTLLSHINKLLLRLKMPACFIILGRWKKRELRKWWISSRRNGEAAFPRWRLKTRVRTSPCSWRAAQRAISGVDSKRHAENVFDDCEVWAGWTWLQEKQGSQQRSSRSQRRWTLKECGVRCPQEKEVSKEGSWNHLQRG